MSSNDSRENSVVAQLIDIVGGEHVLTAEADRAFYAHDVYRMIATPLAVVRPGSIDELCRVVGTASVAGVAIVPRGGGASYTDGYAAITERSITIDTARLNHIDINESDMHVTAECGVPWAELDSALASKGLRTPFWGPFSGLKATVGGSISQGSVSFGSGLHGASADSVLGIEVVLADGTLLKTGAAAAMNGSPFFRHYGPDLSALFTGDAGAMGVKARITLRLVKRNPIVMSASFGFSDFHGMARALEGVAKEGVATENFGLNPLLQKAWLGRTNMKQSMDAALAVFRNSRNPFEGSAKLARMAIAGKRFLDRAEYSAHFIVEGRDNAHARSLLAGVRSAASPYGVEVPNTIPTVVRSMPFMPLYPILGPAGERWVPLHGIMPFSQVDAFHRLLLEQHQRYADKMIANKITHAAMFTTIGTHAFLYEPVFYWQDIRHIYHKRYLPEDFLKIVPQYPENIPGRALVEEMREGIRNIFQSVGAVHMQVGKCYPYMRGRDPVNAAVLKKIKHALDSSNLMNPGSLGL